MQQLLEYQDNDITPNKCFLRRNIENELEGVPENMVDIIKTHKKSTGKYSEKFRCRFEGCNKFFNKACNIQNHFRSHINSKPFIC